eukprot:gb/GFBE01053718.1/.p1 GENE.gb/GFBE01053718.1/~~gb/GFBE01053718.1/.p1  ORF type:complete len:260 (+),score=43.04 gb/GFBE01053718.1/:1-780(+)
MAMALAGPSMTPGMLPAARAAVVAPGPEQLEGPTWRPLLCPFATLGAALGTGSLRRRCKARAGNVRMQACLQSSPTGLKTAPDDVEHLVSGMGRAVKEAMEYMQRADDGVKPHLWKEADLILIGPSRSGKTTLAKFLARLGLKVANYPLVPGEDVPQELLAFDQRRIVKLTTQAAQLKVIREERMRKLGRSKSKYAAMSSIQRELTWVSTFYKRNFPRWPMIDTAKSSLAETAALVLGQLVNAGIDLRHVEASVSSLMS